MGELVRPDFGVARRIKLSSEASFTLGSLVVKPSTRQLIDGARSLTLEPRVMQVLVALARASSEVVSKDELTDCCWDGRVVGEDAINRVISRLRHIAQEFAHGAFEIETIRGVGYRLVGSESDASDAPLLPERAKISGGPVSRRKAIAGVSAATALALGGIWYAKAQRHEPLPLAREYYLRGLETRGQASVDLSEQGAALFREATRIDPQFADAWGALAWNYRGLLQYGPRADAARLQALSRQAAARALELDRDNADAQAALLLLKPFYRNWAELEQGCRRLLKQHPRHSILEYNLAMTLGSVGRMRECMPYLRAVADRERFWPLPQLDLVQALYSSGKIQEAEDLIEDGMKRFPRRPEFWSTRIRYLAITGRLTEAVAFARDLSNRPVGMSSVHPAVSFEMSLVEALADGSPAARAGVLKRASDAARQSPTLIGLAADTAALLDLDANFAMLEGYFFGRGPWAFARSQRPGTAFLFLGMSFAVRKDRRFGSLLAETGLEDYWRSTRTVPDFRRFPDTEYRLPVS